MTRPDVAKDFSESFFGCTDDNVKDRVRNVFRHELFNPVHDDSDPGTAAAWQRIYRQARHINDRFPTAEIVHQNLTWRALLVELAMRSPQLLFVVLSHHSVYLGALEQGVKVASSSLLTEMESMSAFGVVGYTEAGVGSSLWNVGTTARYSAEHAEFTMHTADNCDKFMVNAALPGVAKVALMPAEIFAGSESCGTFSFLVSLRQRGSISPGVSLNALRPPDVLPLDYCTAALAGVTVPHTDFAADGAELDEDGRVHDPLPQLERAMRLVAPARPARIGTAVAAAAMSRASAHLALTYAHSRLTAGPGIPARPMVDYTNVVRELVSAVATACAATAYTEWTVDLIDEGHAVSPDRSATLLKAVTVRMSQHVASTCMRLCGARGLLSINHLALYAGFAQAFEHAGGSNDVLLANVGRMLRQHDRDQTGPELVTASAQVPDSFDGDLENPLPWLKILLDAEDRLRREIDDSWSADGDALQSWNDTFPAAVQLATTQGARLAAQAMLDRALRANTEVVQRTLTALCTFYLIEEVDRRSGWLQSHGLLGAERHLRMADVLTSLARRSMRFLGDVTAAFGVPEDIRVSTPPWRFPAAGREDSEGMAP